MKPPTRQQNALLSWPDLYISHVGEIEQGLTSHQTHYKSYQGRVIMGQMTQPTVSKH